MKFIDRQLRALNIFKERERDEQNLHDLHAFLNFSSCSIQGTNFCQWEFSHCILDRIRPLVCNTDLQSSPTDSVTEFPLKVPVKISALHTSLSVIKNR